MEIKRATLKQMRRLTQVIDVVSVGGLIADLSVLTQDKMLKKELRNILKSLEDSALYLEELKNRIDDALNG